MSKTQQRQPPPDAEARRVAITTLDRPVLVEAGAGTGKTTLLVEHVLHALATEQARMPGVVAITFTEKAAAELRLRLRRALEDRLAREDVQGEPRVRWARALLEFDQARVSTIHAFAVDLLRSRPVEAGIDSQFRVLDELEATHGLREFWNTWVESHVDDPATATALGAALHAGVRLEPDLLQLARDLDAQRDVAGTLAVTPPADLDAVMQQFMAHLSEVVAHAERHCHDPKDGGLTRLRAVAARFAAWPRLPAVSRPSMFLEDFRIDVKGGRADRWDKGACATNKALRLALRDRLTEVRQSVADSLLGGVIAWLARFAADYEREKRQRAVVDFQDLLLHAQRLLRDHIDARRALSGSIDLLCVDEFQDTDPLQAEIVFFLAEIGAPASRWDEVVVGPKLFLVGDPKQSIYRFRRADLEIYARAAARIEACGGVRVDIQHNFRSRPAVLDWVNGTFAALFTGEGPRHVPLSGDPDRGEVPAVWIVEPERDAATPGAEAQRQAEATALVAWIARALEERWPLRTPTGHRALEPRDVALLFARTSGIEIYEAVLRRAGLPFQQEGGRLFFERQEIRDVLQALAAIDDPQDQLAVAACLRSPLFGMSDADLWLHRVRHGDFSVLDRDADSPLAPAFSLLAELHRDRHGAGIAGTIAALLDRTGARALHATQPHAAQALANLEMLQRQARQFESSRGAGLREFVRALHDAQRDAPRVAEWAPQDEDENRIRVLTVHMAKGLEFGCVVLANVAARGNPRAPAVLVDRATGALELQFAADDAEASIATRGYPAARDRERERDDDEDRRLLYVAATRARDYLVVPQPAPGSTGFGRWLLEAPVALQGGADLGEFVRCGDDIPRARACVVAAADLPPLRPARVAGVRVDLRRATERRRSWSALHAEILQQGGAIDEFAPEPSATSPPSATGTDEWPWRAWVTRVLEAERAGAERQAAVERVAADAGEPDRAVELAALVEIAAAYEQQDDSLQARHAVQILVEDGGEWIDARLDLVLAGRDRTRVVTWTLATEAIDPQAVERARRVAAGFAQATRATLEAGFLCLRDGRFTPLG